MFQVQLILDRIQSWITDRICLGPFKEKQLPWNDNQTKWESADLSKMEQNLDRGSLCQSMLGKKQYAYNMSSTTKWVRSMAKGAMITSPIPLGFGQELTGIC